jgi:C4-dicarboxylate-specific signal transduction histidine kinase
MASLGEMAGGIAHEINNPLSIILGYASKISRQLSKPIPEIDSLISDIEKIKETTKRISKIINGLKTFSRSGENDMFLDVSVKTIIEDSLGLCQEKFKLFGVDIILEEIPDLFFECRATQISQILVNLFNNAFDAISVLSTKWIRIEIIELTDHRLQIAVTDSGGGISEANVAKIMQPFFTTKEVGKGTGLGLSISLGIAQDHGGILKIDSSSKNTRFVLELPLKQKK